MTAKLDLLFCLEKYIFFPTADKTQQQVIGTEFECVQNNLKLFTDTYTSLPNWLGAIKLHK